MMISMHDRTTISRTILAVALVALSAPAATAPNPTESMDEQELARRLAELESEAAQVAPAEVRPLVRRFAEQMIHSEIRVSEGRVVAMYERVGWKTRPYYAVNYVRDDYVYVDELDPHFQEELARNLHWISVATTLPDRQLMFELAIDEETAKALKPDELISFTCRLASVIRGGKSVYSRMISFDKVIVARKP